MSDQETMFEIEGQSVSLADIAGLDVSDIVENRGGPFAAGIFDLELKRAALSEVGQTTKYPCVETEWLVLNVVKLDPVPPGEPQPDPEQLVGAIYTETFLIGDLRNLGSVKAMVVDSGVQASGRFAEMLDAWVGCQIRTRIRHKKNKNDEDIVNARISRSKIKPLSQVTGQAA